MGGTTLVSSLWQVGYQRTANNPLYTINVLLTGNCTGEGQMCCDVSAACTTMSCKLMPRHAC
jgi:hypothetical protein